MHQISHLFARFDLRDPLMYGPAPTRPSASHDFGASPRGGRAFILRHFPFHPQLLRGLTVHLGGKHSTTESLTNGPNRGFRLHR